MGLPVTGKAPPPTEELFPQCGCVVGQVFADEGGDEVVAVVISFLHAQGQRDAPFLTGSLQVGRVELVGEEFVTGPLVDQQWHP